MEGLIKWALILGGGYLLYENWLAPAAAASSAAATAATTPATTTTPVTVQSVSTGPASVTQATPVPPPASAPVTVTPVTVPPPPPACANGFTLDAGGICTRYSDTALLANLNSFPWTGSSDIPTEQIMRIDPQILAQYTGETNVTPGSVLAYMLGLGGAAAPGTNRTGSDGQKYTFTGAVWSRQTGLSGPGGMPLNFRLQQTKGVTRTTLRRPGPSSLARLGAAIPAARVYRGVRPLHVRGGL